MPDLITPPVETPAPSPVPQPAEPETLSDHEAQFGPGAAQAATTDDADEGDSTARGDERDERGQFKPKRHRAQSQKATPADVPRINSLTKQLREAQAQLEQFRSSAPPAAPSQEQPRADVKTQAERPASPDRFPSFDTWGAKPENASADFDDYMDARADALFARRLDENRKLYESQQRDAQRTTAQGAVSALEAEIIKDFGTRAQAFIQQTPDFQSVIAPIMNFDLTPLLRQVILEDDNGPKLAYALGSNPDLFHEIMFQTDGKPVSEQSVAILRRRLASLSNTRTQAAATGSAAAPEPRYIAPRPPNPVRTGPMKTGDDLPGDDSSLNDHEKAFGKPRRR